MNDHERNVLNRHTLQNMAKTVHNLLDKEMTGGPRDEKDIEDSLNIIYDFVTLIRARYEQ